MDTFSSSLLVSILLILAACSYHPVCASIPKVIQQSADEELDIFIEGALRNYSNWLTENNHDPTDPIMEPTIVDSTHFWSYPAAIVLEISNQSVSGYSAPMNDIQTQSSFELYMIRAGRNMTGEYIFSGNYNLTGFVKADPENVDGPSIDIPFTGQGSWTIKTVCCSYEFFEYYGFNISDTGFIDLTDAIKSYTFSAVSGDAEFKGLILSEDAKRYEDKIMLSLKWLYESHLRNSTIVRLSPTRRLFEEYMDTIVTTTPLSDIISGEIPPPNTPPPEFTDSTTTDENSSASGCFSKLIYWKIFLVQALIVMMIKIL